MPKINPLIAIGLPTWGKVSVSWAQAYKNVGGPLGSNTVQLTVVGKPIAEARNELMTRAIQEGCDFIFFLGDDVLAPPDVIHRLLNRLWENPDTDLVTGMYWTKQWPTQPYIWRGVQRGPYLDWKHGEYIEIDYAGIDCLLVRLSDRMKALGPEWFSVDWRWEDAKEPTPILLATEDFYFFTKTRAAGMKLWCDTNVQCLHEDRQSGQQFGLLTEMPQYHGSKPVELPEAGTDAAPLVKIADLGSGVAQPFFGHADKVVVHRFDLNEATSPDFRCDVRHLPVPDESYDIVHSRHVLEHFGRAEVGKVLKEWARVLRVGGEFRLSVPNVLYALERIILMEQEIVPVDPYPFWQLYGQQTDERDFHKNGWTPRRIELLLKNCGYFEDVVVEVGQEGPDPDQPALNIFATAKKAKHVKPFALLPEWTEIEHREGFEMAGLRERDNGHAVEREILVV